LLQLHPVTTEAHFLGHPRYSNFSKSCGGIAERRLSQW
jgi:hypothetical protein